MSENETNVEETRIRKPRTMPRILGDFTEVMKAEASGKRRNKLFVIQSDPEEVAKMLGSECFVSATTEEAAINAFRKSLPIRAVAVQKAYREMRKTAILAEWKEAMQSKKEE